MKKSEETLEDFAISYPLDKLAPLEQILFLDIETTGFTSRTSYLYMIGCAYYQAGKWRTIQWMADDYSQEGDILTAFFDFARDYRYLVHFNGNNFDLPFITQKCAQLKLPFSFDGFQGIDIYRRISPYKFFLKLPNCKQKTLEQYLGIARTDVFSGGELIGLYHDYVKNPSEFTEKALFLHNADDLKGMLEVLPILAYYDLFNEKLCESQKSTGQLLQRCQWRTAQGTVDHPADSHFPAQTGNRFCGQLLFPWRRRIGYFKGSHLRRRIKIFLFQLQGLLLSSYGRCGIAQICSRFRGQRAQAPGLRSELLHPEILLLSSPMGDSVHAILQERL